MTAGPTAPTGQDAPDPPARPRRLLAALVGLATLTALAPLAVAAPTLGPSAPTPQPLADTAPERFFDEATVLDAPTQTGFPPLQGAAIHPGRQLLVDLPQVDGTTLCTMNFVYEDASGDAYVGTAGHCVLPDGVEDSSSKAFEQPEVRVCVRFCVGSLASVFVGDHVELGDVLYARQEHDGHIIGEDYAFVRVPDNRTSLLEPSVPVWGGPKGERGDVYIGEPVTTYGQGVVYGDAELDARAGVSLGRDLGGSDGAFWAGLPILPADSGGPVLTQLDPLDSRDDMPSALGAATHTFGSALSAGTLSTYAVAFTEAETGVSLTLVTADDPVGS